MDELESEILSEMRIDELEMKCKKQIEEEKIKFLKQTKKLEKQIEYWKKQYDDLENENSCQKERICMLEESDPVIKISESDHEILSELQVDELEMMNLEREMKLEKQIEYWKKQYDDLENENSCQKETVCELEEYALNVKTVDDEFRAKICLKLYNNIELEQLQELEIKFNLRFKK